MNEMNSYGHQSTKELRRTRQGKIIAGVCSGAGEFLGVDANILRLALAVATFFGGLGIGIYAVAWLLIPEEGKSTSIVQDLISKQKSEPNSVWQQASGHFQQASTKWKQQQSQAPYADQPVQDAPRQSPVDEPPAKF
ncbi:PspC domain-containing protein [Sphaerisporangium aureirubrum]|uniref:PspC domain-containing protein n=1 Tax=Sphaerisporangium aureirubrum TaxID=1544736 RepID=A0ABW1NCR9_9ACTN